MATRRLKAELQRSQSRPPRCEETLPYWQKLATQFPSSPYAAEALDHAANLQLAGDQWKPAAEDLEKLLKDFPKSRWAGDAYVALIDIRLERLLDLEWAQIYADAAVKWYESKSPLSLGEGKGEGSRDEGLSSARDPFCPFPPMPARPVREVGYEIYLRGGLLEYLHEQFGAAITLFEKAKPLAPAQPNIQVIGKPPSTGIERLIDAAKTGKTLTPNIVRKGDSTAKLGMMLADIYQEARQYEKSLDLCNRLLASAAVKRRAGAAVLRVLQKGPEHLPSDGRQVRCGCNYQGLFGFGRRRAQGRLGR